MQSWPWLLLFLWSVFWRLCFTMRMALVAFCQRARCGWQRMTKPPCCSWTICSLWPQSSLVRRQEEHRLCWMHHGGNISLMWRIRTSRAFEILSMESYVRTYQIPPPYGVFIHIWYRQSVLVVVFRRREIRIRLCDKKLARWTDEFPGRFSQFWRVLIETKIAALERCRRYSYRRDIVEILLHSSLGVCAPLTAV